VGRFAANHEQPAVVRERGRNGVQIRHRQRRRVAPRIGLRIVSIHRCLVRREAGLADLSADGVHLAIDGGAGDVVARVWKLGCDRPIAGIKVERESFGSVCGAIVR